MGWTDIDTAGNVAPKLSPPPRYDYQHSPPTTHGSLHTSHYSQPDHSEHTPDTATPSGLRGRVPLDEGAPSDSPISIQGSSDRQHPGTRSTENDNYLGPLVQWHIKEAQHSGSVHAPVIRSAANQANISSLHSTSQPYAPPSTLASHSLKNDTQYQPMSHAFTSVFTHSLEPVQHVRAPRSQPCQRFYPGPAVGYCDVPLHPPPPLPPTLPAWAVNERPVKTSYISPDSPATQNTWQQPSIHHGLHILAAAANWETPSSARHPIDFKTYSVAADDQAVLHAPTSSPYAAVDFDDSPQYCPETPSIYSESAVTGADRRVMKEDGDSGRGRRDKNTTRKQETFRRKAENARDRRRNSVVNKTPTKTPMSNTRKRKSRTGEPSFAVQQTVAPALSSAFVHGFPDPFLYGSNAVNSSEQHACWNSVHDSSRQDQVPQSYTNATASCEPSQLPSQDYIPRQDYTYRPPDHSLPPSAPDPDVLDQSITTDYGSYRWSAKLYAIDEDKTGYQYAESWIESLFRALGGGIKRHTHVTRGFIEGGNQLTFLVLHNAADPFKYGSPPASTVSFGCYGFHWYDHADIRWTTLTADLRFSLNQFMLDGYISEIKKWHPLMPAKEKRFHRAYWLAATMSPLRTILNRNTEGTVVESVEAAENYDDGFEITELDLNNEGCELSMQEVELRWKECEEIAEGEVPGYGPEHIVTGSSEH